MLSLDSDAAGEEAMPRCVEYENLIGNEIKVAIMPPGVDPDDVIRKDESMWKAGGRFDSVIDYTFDMVTSKLNMSTAKDKTIAAGRLMPIIAEIEDRIRRAHYLQKLSRLVGVRVRELETMVKKPIKYNEYGNKKDKSRPAATIRPAFSQPIEEYCLTLLLQFPKLKYFKHRLKTEYFENSENREIFMRSQTEDRKQLKHAGLYHLGLPG